MTERGFIENFMRENLAYVRERYAQRNKLTVAAKSHAGDLLTEVDLTLQKRAMDRLAIVYPGDHFVGEEEGRGGFPDDPDARVWVMDPLDGTYNFVRGLYPVFGVSLAFARNGLVEAAGVLLPELEALFLAERGNGATRNGSPLRVSQVREPEAAALMLDFAQPEQFNALLRQAAPLTAAAGQVRCLGSAVVALCQIATGDADAYLHCQITPWDFAAAQLIVEEAGGRATRLDGGPLQVFDEIGAALFTNGALHDTLLAMLNGPEHQAQ